MRFENKPVPLPLACHFCPMRDTPDFAVFFNPERTQSHDL
jgi:hypothetical protein